MLSPAKQKETRTYRCVKCSLHGKESLMKNHSRFCPFIYCECKKCFNLQHYRSTAYYKCRLAQLSKAEATNRMNGTFLGMSPDSQPLPRPLSSQTVGSFIKQKLEKLVPPEKDNTNKPNSPTSSTNNLLKSKPPESTLSVNITGQPLPFNSPPVAINPTTSSQQPHIPSLIPTSICPIYYPTFELVSANQSSLTSNNLSSQVIPPTLLDSYSKEEQLKLLQLFQNFMTVYSFMHPSNPTQ